MRDFEFNLNSFDNYAGKAYLQDLLNKVRINYPNINKSSTNKLNKLIKVIKESSLNLDSPNKNIEFYLSKPDSSKLYHLQNMAEEYYIYTSSKDKINFELNGKWKNFYDLIDYRKNNSLLHAKNSLDEQLNLVEQIPFNRIQNSKTELMENLEEQNRTKDRKAKSKLINKFKDLESKIEEDAKIEKISETSLSDVRTYKRFLDLDEKRTKSNFNFILISSIIIFLMLACITIAVVILAT